MEKITTGQQKFAHKKPNQQKDQILTSTHITPLFISEIIDSTTQSINIKTFKIGALINLLSQLALTTTYY